MIVSEVGTTDDGARAESGERESLTENEDELKKKGM